MKRLPLQICLAAMLLGCKAEWQKEDKERIKADCLLAAQKYGFDEPEKHCDCVLNRIISRYPNPNEFENMEMGEFGNIVLECQGKDVGTRVIWPEKTQKAFVDSCTSMARRENKNEPKAYCTCVLEEIMKRYPTNDDLSTMNAREMADMAKRCER